MPDDAKSAQTMAEGARWRKAPDDDANRPKRWLRARDGRPKRWHEGQMEDESTFMEHHLREEEATCFEVSQKRKGKAKRSRKSRKLC